MNLDTKQPHGATMLPSRDELENRPYVHQAYPSTRFHPDQRTVNVADEAADQALGKPWANTPYPPPPYVIPAVEPTLEELKAAVQDLIRKNEGLELLVAKQATQIAEKRWKKQPKVETPETDNEG